MRRRRSNLFNDLIALRYPRLVARRESMRVTSLAHAIRANRITVEEALSQLRGIA